MWRLMVGVVWYGFCVCVLFGWFVIDLFVCLVVIDF